MEPENFLGVTKLNHYTIEALSILYMHTYNFREALIELWFDSGRKARAPSVQPLPPSRLNKTTNPDSQ